MEIIYPKLSSQAVIEELKDGTVVLQHKVAKTQLRLSNEDGTLCRYMTGQLSLEELETSISQSGTPMAYQELTRILYQLWDRGLLENEEEIRIALFPGQAERMYEKAMHGRSYKWIYSGATKLRGGFTSTPILTFSGLLGLIGVFLYWTGTVSTDENFFTQISSSGANTLKPFKEWFSELIVIYFSASVFLTVRGAVRGAILVEGEGIPAIFIRWAAGIFYWDVDDRQLFHSSSDKQVRFALGSVVHPLGIASGLALLGYFSGAEWLHQIALTGLVICFFDLCPFFNTSGARLLESIGNLKKQRFRVGSFIQQRMVQSILDDKDYAEDKAFRYVATAWILWFFGFIKIFSELVIQQQIELIQVVVHAQSTLEQIVSGALLAYTVALTFALLGSIAYLVFGMVWQMFRPTKASKPSFSTKGAQLSTELKGKLSSALRELPMLADLSHEQLAQILDSSEELTYSKGSWVYRQDEDDNRFFWVLEGALELQKDLPEGGFKSISLILPDHGVGEEALLRQPRALSLKAIEQCRVLSITGLTGLGDGKSVDELLSISESLEHFPEMSGLSATGKMTLATRSSIRACEQGTRIIQEGDSADSLFLIKTGEVVVQKNESVIAEISSGSLFGEMGVLFNNPRTASVLCKTDCELIEVPALALQEAMSRSFHVGLAIETIAAQRSENP